MLVLSGKPVFGGIARGKLFYFQQDENEVVKRLIKDTGKMAYSFENTMYGTQGPERTVWDEEVHDAMNAYEKNREDT